MKQPAWVTAHKWMRLSPGPRDSRSAAYTAEPSHPLKRLPLSGLRVKLRALVWPEVPLPFTGRHRSPGRKAGNHLAQTHFFTNEKRRLKERLGTGAGQRTSVSSSLSPQLYFLDSLGHCPCQEVVLFSSKANRGATKSHQTVKARVKLYHERSWAESTKSPATGHLPVLAGRSGAISLHPGGRPSGQSVEGEAGSSDRPSSGEKTTSREEAGPLSPLLASWSQLQAQGAHTVRGGLGWSVMLRAGVWLTRGASEKGVDG